MLKQVKKIVSLSLVFAILSLQILSLFLVVPAWAAGATLFFSPSTKTIDVGASVSVAVMVNSGGGAGINAGEASVSFPADLLKVNSVSQTNSIFELWTTKPSFSNSAGTVSFGGGLTSAYSGSAGRIVSISFKALKPGNAKLSFGGSVVTAADGMGTNIFASGGSASFTINEPAPAKIDTPKTDITSSTNTNVATTTTTTQTTTPSSSLATPDTTTTDTQAKGVLPPAPEVTSPTHPDKDAWYNVNKVQLDWRLLASVTGEGFDLGANASSTPPDHPGAVVQTKTYDNVPNGRNFFHIRLENKAGWGPVATRQVLIDNEFPTKPILSIDNGGDGTNPNQNLKIQTEDKVSGISKVKIWINGAEKTLEPRNFMTEPYTFDKLMPGTYSVAVAVSDKANNTSTSSIAFAVDPLKAPIITNIPKEIKTIDNLSVRGSTFYPNSTITVFIATVNGDPITADVKADDNGNWTYYHPTRLNASNYEVWAKVTDTRGAQSLGSPKNGLAVTPPEIIAVYGLYIILFLLFVIIILALYIYLLKKGFDDERKKAMAETQGAQTKINEIFLALHEEVDELIEYADKKAGLSESERRVKEKLKEALDISEEFLIKEIEDVEKEILLPKSKKK